MLKRTVTQEGSVFGVYKMGMKTFSLSLCLYVFSRDKCLFFGLRLHLLPYFCMQAANVLAILSVWAGLSMPSLMAVTTSIISLCTGLYRNV